MKDELKSDLCSKFLKGLAAPERLKIIQCLQKGEMNVSDIAASLKSDIANVSHHLGVLRHAGLVRDRKDGKFVIYSLNPELFQHDLKQKLTGLLDLGCCRIDLGKAPKQ